jgi:hypothetical protein
MTRREKQAVLLLRCWADRLMSTNGHVPLWIVADELEVETGAFLLARDSWSLPEYRGTFAARALEAAARLEGH